MLNEGHNKEKVHFVGHVMIDNLFYQLSKLEGKTPSDLAVDIKDRLPQKYICMTMHRPSNVDDKEILWGIITALKRISEETPIIFPCHPRTRKQIELFGFLENFKLQTPDSTLHTKGTYLTDPLGYDYFLYL